MWHILTVEKGATFLAHPVFGWLGRRHYIDWVARSIDHRGS